MATQVEAGAAWPWRHFTPQELGCSCRGRLCGGGGEYFHDPDFLDALEELRSLQGRALIITSARRCKKRNAEVGGAKASRHMLAVAADIRLESHDPVALARNAARAGFTGLGFGNGFIHVDMRPGGRVGFYYSNAPWWTKRFGFDPRARFNATGVL